MSYATVIAPTSSPKALHQAVVQAVALLRAGDLVALPTETVYGLAANALNAQAVERIFSAKGRPTHNPLIVHVANVEMARGLVAEWPKQATRLTEAFWPGPLTIVLPKSPVVPDVVTAGGSTVGLRWPSHPIIQAVIRACDFPLAAPSANLSTEVSPTTAEHVRRSLEGRIPLILDGGSAQIGIESTVLDLTVTPPRVLRPGMIHTESLEAVLGPVCTQAATEDGVLRSPGLLLKHYSPKARLVLWDGSAEFLEQLVHEAALGPNQVHLLMRENLERAHALGRVSVMPSDPTSYARAIYAELHRCDAEGAQLIVAEAVPDTPKWQAIGDRLRRAAAV